MTKKDYIYVFDNVGDFTKWVRNKKQTTAGKNHNLSVKEGERQTEFTGTKSFEQAQNLLDNGDHQLSRMIIDTNREIKASSHMGQTLAMSIERSAQGFIPNIGAYMTGHPYNMLNVRQAFKPMSKVISIVYNIVVSCYIQTNQMISAASKVSSAIATLEAKGYRINLYICMCALNHNTKSAKCKAGFIIKIKDAGRPMDPLRIAYPLANPSMARRHGFAFFERADWKLPGNYGSPMNFSDIELRPIVGNHIYLSAMNIIDGNNNMDYIVNQIESTSKKS